MDSDGLGWTAACARQAHGSVRVVCARRAIAMARAVSPGAPRPFTLSLQAVAGPARGSTVQAVPCGRDSVPSPCDHVSGPCGRASTARPAQGPCPGFESRPPLAPAASGAKPYSAAVVRSGPGWAGFSGPGWAGFSGPGWAGFSGPAASRCGAWLRMARRLQAPCRALDRRAVASRGARPGARRPAHARRHGGAISAE
jgi:hypothetical protein